MAAPCGAIIAWVLATTGLTSLFTYYSLTSNLPIKSSPPMSTHIGTLVATKTVQPVLNTIVPTIHHSLWIDAPPPPELSIVIDYTFKPTPSGPGILVPDSNANFMLGDSVEAISAPLPSLLNFLLGLLCILVMLNLLYTFSGVLSVYRQPLDELFQGFCIHGVYSAKLKNMNSSHAEKIRQRRREISEVEKHWCESLTLQNLDHNKLQNKLDARMSELNESYERAVAEAAERHQSFLNSSTETGTQTDESSLSTPQATGHANPTAARTVSSTAETGIQTVDTHDPCIKALQKENLELREQLEATEASKEKIIEMSAKMEALFQDSQRRMADAVKWKAAYDREQQRNIGLNVGAAEFRPGAV